MATRDVSLTEFTTERGVALSAAERDALRQLHPGIRVEPSIGSSGRYDLTADQHVGVIALPTLTVRVRPKVPMSSVLFLVQYGCGVSTWLDGVPEQAEGVVFSDLLALSLARAVSHATRQGLLHGYRTEEEALQSPRGTVLVGEQIRRRYRMSAPVEIRHDLFTADIVENRILLAALSALQRLQLNAPAARTAVHRARMLFGGVNTVRFGPADIPPVPITRLNRHYEASLALATLVLRSVSLDVQRGAMRGSAFLVDMNDVFERFVRRSLRVALAARVVDFPDRAPQHHLDERDRVTLRPDLMWLANGHPVWLGDAKYKRLPVGGYRNADLYQLFAYCSRFSLPAGTLIYAADEGVRSVDHVVRASGKTLQVRALDLAVLPQRILHQIQAIASMIRLQVDSRHSEVGATLAPVS